MPIDKTYAKKVYDSLRDDVEGFDKDEATFYKLIETDKNYLKNVHLTLKDVYGDDFDKDESMFESALGLKKKEPTTSLGYEKPSETLRMGGLPKQEKLSQSPLKTAAATTPSVSTKSTEIKLQPLNIEQIKSATTKSTADIGKPDVPKQVIQKIDITTEKGSRADLSIKRDKYTLGLEEASKRFEALSPQYEELKTQLDEVQSLYEQAPTPEIQSQYNSLISQLNPISDEINRNITTAKTLDAGLRSINQLEEINREKNFGFGSKVSAAVGSTVNNLVNSTGKIIDTFGDLNYEFNELIGAGALNEKDFNDKATDRIASSIDEYYKRVNESIDKKIPESYSKYSPISDKPEADKLLYFGLNSIAQLAPTIAATLTTGGLGALATGFAMEYGGMYDTFHAPIKQKYIDQGLSEAEAEKKADLEAGLMAIGGSTVVGQLDRFGAVDMLNAVTKKALAKKITQDALVELGEKTGKEAAEQAIKKSITKNLVEFTKGYGKAVATETFTEPVQELVAPAITDVYNAATGEDTFKEGGLGDIETWKNAGNAGIGAFLASSPAGTISGVQRVTSQGYNTAMSITNEAEKEKFVAILNDEVESGLTTPEQAEEAIKASEKIQEVDALIPNSIEIPQQRLSAVNLLMEKQELSEQIEGKDKALSAPQIERIKAIDEELSRLASTKETTTKDGEGTIEGAVSTGTDVAEEGFRVANEPGSEGVTGEGVQAETVPQAPVAETKPSENISTAADSKGVYLKDGEYGFIRTEGQLVVFETNDKIIDLGNKDELAETPISEFGIEKEEILDVQVNEDNSVVVEGVKFVNNFSNPQAAINTDADGNVVSVNLETEDGKKRTIRGQRAEEIAYQYKLKEFEQNATEESIARLEQEITRLEEEAKKPKPQTKKRSTAKRKSKEVAPVTSATVTAPAIEVTPTAETPTQEVKDKVEGSGGVGGDVDFTAKGGNKAVDEKGEPITVYHGTGEDFKDLDETKQNEATGHGDFGKGFYFSAKEGIAKYYSLKFKNRIVKKFNINVKNPFEINITNEIFDDATKKSLRGLKYLQDYEKEIILNATSGNTDFGYKKITKELGDKRFSDILKENGYDAVFVNRTLGGETTPKAEIVVFDKSQIKAVEQSLKETPKAETKSTTSNVGVEEGSGGVGGDVETTPQKIKVLGKDVNMYNDYIPSKIEDVEPDAMYSFNANSKDGIPTLLHDIAYANKREVNGVKSENWHASISGEELLKLYPKETPKAKPTKPAAKVETAKEAAKTESKKSKPEQIGEGLLDALGLEPVEPTEGEVKFSKTTGKPQLLTPTVEKEQEVIDQMNKMNLVNDGIDLVTTSTTKEEIDVKELNSRLENPLGTVEWTDYEGVPFTFTISDQLRTGDAVNPNTGQTITNLKGGIGFNGTKGNENNAWANTTKEEAEAMLQRAKDVYANNKPLFDKLWKEGKLPNGHIPMAVVKMAETSILSNEAVFRVGIQNIETLPKSNRKKAVSELAKSMQAKIDTESASLKRGVDKNGKPYTENTVKLKKKAINQYQKILDSINKNKYDDIVDVLKDKDNFSLPEKSLIANEVFYGSPTPIGGKEIDISRSRPSTPVSKALLGNANPSLINLGKITDLLSEPSMKNVPNMHVVSIVGVDIKATEVNKINHPNYPYGVKGVSIGVIKNPVHMKDAFGEAYGSALGQVVKNEAANASVSIKSALTQGIPVQSGLPNRVFKSAIAKGALDSVDKLAGFLRQAFPNTTFFTSNEAWEAAMADPSIKKKLKDRDVVYAFTTDGNVFINPSLKTTKATLHETGHIWMGFVKENNPALHAKGLDLVTGTKEHQKAIKEYGDTELAREEALMELMSSKGDTIVNASQKAKFKEWLLSVYKYIADNFTSLLGLSPKQIEDLTLDKFLEGMLADVLSGKEITTKKIKGEVKFSRESQNDKIKEYIEGQRKSGQSDKDIKAGLELVADKVGLTPEDINNLMGVDSNEAKPLKGFKPKEKPAKEAEAEKTGTRAFAARSSERAGVPIEDIPASLRFYSPTTVEEQQKIAEDFISKNGIDNTITALRLPDSGIDPKSKPVLASVLLNALYAEQNNTTDIAEIEKIAIDVHNVLDSVLTAATEAAQFMAMMREFYNSNPYNYVAQVTRLIEKNINNPIKANVATAVVDINKANKEAAAKAASNVVKEVVTTKVTSAKEKFERSKANLKALWKKSFNVGIAANQYEAAKNDVEFAKALTIMAKDFVVYQSVQFGEFLKEVASQIGLNESDIDKDHLRKIFEKAKSERIQAGIKVGLKELELKLKDLIESHYSATEIKGKLIDKLKSEFGVGSDFGLNDAAIKELEDAIKREIKVLTAKEKIKALKALGIKEQKDVNEILSLSEEGLLDDNSILETLGDKLGIKKLTPEEAAKLADLAKDIKESKEDRIKARNIQKFEDYKFVLAKKYKIQDFLISNYLTNIFGSLTSNEKNIAGNVSETILLVGELMGNALASGNPKDIQRALKALVEGNIRGFDFTKEVITTGVASYKEPGDIRARNMWELIMDRKNDLTRVERNLQMLFKIPYLGPTLLAERRFWNRALLSMDSLSGTTNNELGSLLAATREADKQNLRGAKRTKFIEEQMQNSAEAQEEARNYAISAGYKEGTGEFNRAVANYLVSKRPEAIKKAAAEYSARATLTQNPPASTMTGAIANGLNDVISKNPNIKFFVPVVNTFANLIVKNIERSPFEILSLAFDAGRAAAGVESAKAGLTKAEVARRMKTAAVWTAISVLLFALAGGTDDDEEGFEVFGSGTGDPAVDNARRALGWKPNTVRFSKDGGYYNFEFLPFGFVLGMIGNMRDYFKYKNKPAFAIRQAQAKKIFGKNLDALDKNEREQLEAELAIPGKYNISAKERKEFANLSAELALTPVTYSFQLLKSLGELVNAVGEGAGAINTAMKSITSIGRGLASPRYLGEVRDIFDNKLYDSKEFRNVIGANVPFVKLGNVKLDAFGREIEKYKSESILSGIKYALTRGFYNPPTITELDQFLWENGVGVSVPSNTPSMAYTEDVYREYIVTRGKILITNLTEALKNKEFEGLSPQDVLEVVNIYATNANAEARYITDEKLDKLK